MGCNNRMWDPFWQRSYDTDVCFYFGCCPLSIPFSLHQCGHWKRSCPDMQFTVLLGHVYLFRDSSRTIHDCSGSFYGTAHELHLLFGMSLFTCVLLTSLDVFLFPLFSALLETAKAKFTCVCLASFALLSYLFGVLVSQLDTSLLVGGGMLINFSGENGFALISLLATSIKPHNFYLHSSFVQDGNMFDSEMFEWTQRPCSPKLCASPLKMQITGCMTHYLKGKPITLIMKAHPMPYLHIGTAQSGLLMYTLKKKLLSIWKLSWQEAKQ